MYTGGVTRMIPARNLDVRRLIDMASSKLTAKSNQTLMIYIVCAGITGITIHERNLQDVVCDIDV